MTVALITEANANSAETKFPARLAVSSACQRDFTRPPGAGAHDSRTVRVLMK